MCAVSFGEEFASLAGAVGVAGEGEDFGRVDEAVDHGGCDDVVGEGLSPASEGEVRGDHHGALFVAGRDQLEQQVRGVLVERDVADLIDDEQPVAAELLQLGLEAAGLMSGGEAGDPVLAVSNRTECPARAALTPRPMARWVLPIPGGPSRTTFSAFETNVPVAKCARTSRRSEGRWSRLKSSSVLTCGKWAVWIRITVPLGSRSATCRCSRAARYSS